MKSLITILVFIYIISISGSCLYISSEIEKNGDKPEFPKEINDTDRLSISMTWAAKKILKGFIPIKNTIDTIKGIKKFF